MHDKLLHAKPKVGFEVVTQRRNRAVQRVRERLKRKMRVDIFGNEVERVARERVQRVRAVENQRHGMISQKNYFVEQRLKEYFELGGIAVRVIINDLFENMHDLVVAFEVNEPLLFEFGGGNQSVEFRGRELENKPLEVFAVIVGDKTVINSGRNQHERKRRQSVRSVVIQAIDRSLVYEEQFEIRVKNVFGNADIARSVLEKDVVDGKRRGNVFVHIVIITRICKNCNNLPKNNN